MHLSVTFSVRDAILTDVEAFRAVGHASWRDTYTGLMPQDYIEHGLSEWWSSEAIARAIQSVEHIALVAETGSEVVGVAQTSPNRDGQSATLWKLYVRKPHRGKGIGSALIAETARRLPPAVDTLFTEYLTANEPAARFYTCMGFVFDHKEQDAFNGQIVRSTYVKRRLPPRPTP